MMNYTARYNGLDEFTVLCQTVFNLCDATSTHVIISVGQSYRTIESTGDNFRLSENVLSSIYQENDATQLFCVQPDSLSTYEPACPPNCSLTSMPLMDESDKFYGTLCVVHQGSSLPENVVGLIGSLSGYLLSCMHHRDELLNLTEEKFQNLLQLDIYQESQRINNIGVWELDINSGQTFWTDQVYQIYEVDPEFDHNKLTAMDFYHPEDRHIIADAVSNATKQGVPYDVITRFITAKGNLRWVRSTGRRIDSNPRKPRLVGSFQDITGLMTNELKFKGIFNSNLNFISFLDKEGRVVEMNEAALESANLSLEDVVGKKFWDCYWWNISESSREELYRSFQLVLQGEEINYEVDVWFANRQPMTVLFSMRPVLDNFGDVLYVLAKMRSIQEIAEIRDRYKALIDATKIGTWYWNVQTGEAIFDERWQEIFGYSNDELTPISLERLMTFVHPDEKDAFVEQLNLCIHRQNEHFNMEVRIQHKKGHWVWTAFTGKVLRWTETGEPWMLGGANEDISEEMHTKEQLRINEQSFRSLFENAPIGMALVDPTGKWLKVNKRVCEILGYSENELMQMTFQEITHAEDLHMDVQFVSELIEEKQNHYQMNKRYIHKSGKVVSAILAVSAVRDEHGKVRHFISQIVDVTN